MPTCDIRFERSGVPPGVPSGIGTLCTAVFSPRKPAVIALQQYRRKVNCLDARTGRWNGGIHALGIVVTVASLHERYHDIGERSPMRDLLRDGSDGCASLLRRNEKPRLSLPHRVHPSSDPLASPRSA